MGILKRYMQLSIAILTIIGISFPHLGSLPLQATMTNGMDAEGQHDKQDKSTLDLSSKKDVTNDDLRLQALELEKTKIEQEIKPGLTIEKIETTIDQQHNTTVESISKPIQEFFPDSVLAGAVAKALGKENAQALVSTEELAAIKSLEYNGFKMPKINTIEGMQYLTNIQSLKFYFAGISDISQLANLTSLTNLNLAINSISDVAPLAKLTKLERLNLSLNNIEDISSLANLANLKQLILQANQIKDISPLTNLLGIERLNIETNGLTDITPIINLVNLTELFISSNFITDISPISKLTSMRELDISYNDIIDISPLRNLRDLIDLMMGYNAISDITPLANLSKLSFLDAAVNNITELTPLANLTNLKTLYLQRNKIADVSPLKSLTQLNEFLLANQEITGEVLWGWHVSYDNPLRDLDGNMFAPNLPTGVQKFPQVWYGAPYVKWALPEPTEIHSFQYSWSKDIVIGQDSAVFSGTDSVRVIPPQSIRKLFPDIFLAEVIRAKLNKPSRDSLVSQTELDGIKELKYRGRIDDNDGEIQSLAGIELVRKATKLEFLGNKISDVTPLKDLRSLSWLNLAYNDITSIAPLASLPSITVLLVYSNELTDIRPVANLRMLEQFLFDRNKISDITPLANLTKLWNLQMGHNQIRDISVVKKLPNLQYLDVDSNELADIRPIAGLTKLIDLDLNANQISDVSPLSNLTNLKTLRLGWNQISNITPLKKLTRVTTLQLVSQKVSEHVIYREGITVENTTKDLNGNLIAPNIISAAGRYDAPFITWHLPMPDNNNSLIYRWSQDVKVGSVTAQFSGEYEATLDKFYVEFMVDGTEYENVQVIPDALIAEPEIQEREGYLFTGWYTEEDKGYQWVFGRYTMPEENLKLYARFEPIKHAVVYIDEGNVHNIVDTAFGEKLAEPEAPTKEDYFFVGWFTADDKQWDFAHDTMPADYLVLYAQYVKAYYTVTFDNDGEITTDTVTIEEPITASSPSKEGYQFIGWFTADGKQWDFARDLMPRHDINLYARFETIVFDVTFMNDGTIIKTDSVRVGNKLTEPEAPTKPGFTFVGWFTAEVEGESWDFDKGLMPAEDIILYARFEVEKLEYTLTYQNEDEIIGVQIITAGERIPEPEKPTKVGYIFLAWYTEKTSGKRWDFTKDTMPAANLTLYARFIPQRFNVIFINDLGDAPERQTIAYGNKVVKPDDPIAEGYRFVGWFTAPTEGAQWDFENDTIGLDNVTLYARWEQSI